MATNHCPDCHEQLPDSAKMCPRCGKWIVPASELEDVPTKTSLWQKIVIVAALIILVAIGLTFRGAEERENQAAQKDLSAPLAAIITKQIETLGLGSSPKAELAIETKRADVRINFPAMISAKKAEDFGLAVCAGLARVYVDKGYMPRALAVEVGSLLPDGALATYGRAIFNGNLDALGWEPATAR